MKTSSALQGLYATFLGLAVVAFFGVGMATFYPRPDQGENMDWEDYQPIYSQWSIYTSIALLVLAVVVLVIALFWAEKIAVLANGLLLGGLFTLFYAVILTLDSDVSVLRFAMVTVALIIAIAVGWYRFASRRYRPSEGTQPAAAGGLITDRLTAEGYAALEARVSHIEHQLDAIAAALRNPAKDQ